jgi:hypothetical protein
METIKQVLMARDGMSESAAEDLIREAQEDLNERLACGEDAEDICMEYFGLEPDYIMELL